MSKWVFAAIFISCVSAEATLEGFADSDSVLLKDGSLHRGLIVQNTAKEVLLQGRYSIQSFPKSEIVRIHNEADIGLEFTKANTPGDLPAWRVMVNDLRNNDAVKSLEQIPATAIDNGTYKNIPYLSFRINGLIEMNIYGTKLAGFYGAFSRAFFRPAKKSARSTRCPSLEGKNVSGTFAFSLFRPRRPMPTAVGGSVFSIPKNSKPHG